MELKSHIKAFFAMAASMLMLAFTNSCTFDDTELQNSIDDLTARIEALENFQEQVQGDIASLQEIIAKLQSSVTVNNVVETENGYTINFSDGTSVTVSNGKDGMTPPSITVVEEGGTYYWAYENADGTTEFIRDGDGNKIPVTGEAPQVRINEETGNWEISTDGGQTWEDTEVKAEGSDGDSFFKNVYSENGILYLVLSDGTTIQVPMTAGLAFDFGTEEAILYFEAGESKTLDYTMSGQESVTITKPDGWRASIEAEGLVITAPVAENTFAETEGVISVILISANGQSFMAEQKVAVGEEEEVELPDYDPLVGDYYYSDGTWSTELDASKTAIGVVIWTGDPAQDDPILKADHPECTHGLVLSSKEFSGTWQENCGAYGQTIDAWRATNLPEYESLMYWVEYYVTNGPIDKMLGYQHTKAIKAFNEDPANSEWPVNIVSGIPAFNKDVPAPKTSSGWFLPSIKQMSCLNSGNLSSINNVFSSIPEGNAMNAYGYYLTSTEYVDIMPNGVTLFQTMFFDAGSSNKNFGNSYRYMLAF